MKESEFDIIHIYFGAIIPLLIFRFIFEFIGNIFIEIKLGLRL